MSRDYAREMRTIIDAETADGAYSAPVVAAAVVEKLRATDPDLLAGWLDANAADFIRQAIGTRDRSARSHARVAERRGAFAKDAKDFEDRCSATALEGWLGVPYTVNEDNERKPLALMVKADLLYVADDYQVRSKANLMEEAFMRALANKVGLATVGDRFSNEQIAVMRSSLGLRSAA